jgi:hypothetical protein
MTLSLLVTGCGKSGLITLNLDAGSADSCVAGPTLTAITLTPTTIDIGGQVTIGIETQGCSPLAAASGTFESAFNGLVSFACATPSNGSCQAKIQLPMTASACGDWHLKELLLRDMAGNMVHLDNTDAMVAASQFTVSSATGACCAIGPTGLVVHGVSVSPDVISNQTDNTMTVTVDVTDSCAAVTLVNGRVEGPIPPGGGTAGYYWFTPTAPGNGSNWVGTFTLNAHAAAGTWRVVYLFAQDQAHNQLRITDPADPVLSAATFVVN